MGPIDFLSDTNQAVGPAVFGSVMALGGSIWSYVVSPDVIPVIGGIGIGIVGIGWSVFAAGRDRRVNTLMDEIATLQLRLKESNVALLDCERASRELIKEVARLEATVVGLQTKLATVNGS